jgi:argininosuccinate lyase
VCEQRGIELADLSDEDFAAIAPQLTPGVRAVLTVAGSIASRNAKGGTARDRVVEQAARLARLVEAQAAWAHTPTR